MKIPKIIHQIWIGDKPAPKRWMKSWQEKNPDWKYILWDNKRVSEFIHGGFADANINQLNFYWKQKRWHGAADILRYLILYEFGGFMPCADEECLRPIGGLFDDNYELYAVVNDCGKFNDPVDLTLKNANVTPLYASTPGNPFVKHLIDRIGQYKKPGKPWIFTGNNLMKIAILDQEPEIIIWPAFYFVPEYKDGTRYKGDFKPYGEQYWGTTRQNYNKGV